MLEAKSATLIACPGAAGDLHGHENDPRKVLDLELFHLYFTRRVYVDRDKRLIEVVLRRRCTRNKGVFVVTKEWLTVGLVALMLCGCAGAHREATGEAGEGNETKVPMSQVPSAVQSTFAQVSQGAKVDSMDMEQADGKTVYEGDAVIGGQNYEIKIDPSGKLISKSVDNEEAEKAGDKKEEKVQKEDKD